MWATEWGWETGGKSPSGPLTEDAVAAYVPRAFILADAAGVSALCWFSAEDSVDGPMGLEDNRGVKRRQYQAFKTLTRQLGAWALVRQVSGQTHPTSGIQAYLFRGSGGCKLAAWNIDGPAPAVINGKGGALHAVDDLGSPRAPVGVRRGQTAFLLGPGPLYINGASADVRITAGGFDRP